MSRLSVGKFIFGMIFLGLIWWALKPVIDMFTGDLLYSVASDFGVTNQELAYFGLLPLLIGIILVAWLIIRVMKGRARND